MGYGIIKGKEWEVDRDQLAYIKKYDETKWKRYHKAVDNNYKIRKRRKYFLSVFIMVIFIIGFCARCGIMQNRYLPSGNKFDFDTKKSLILGGISCLIYLGTLLWGFLMIYMNDMAILKIAEEYGTVNNKK